MSDSALRIGNWSIEEFQALTGQELGVSDWVNVTQDMIDQFGAATLDPDPMHVDPDWCKENSPFQSTIAFGFLTMSLLIHLFHDVMKYRSQGSGARNSANYGLNYGFDRLRLISPVPAGARVRGRFTLKEFSERKPGEYLQVISCVVEIEGREKPALIGDWLSLFVDERGHQRVKRDSMAL